jgi:hypothetical protein
MAAEAAVMESTAPILDPMAQTALRTLKDIVVPAPASWMPQTWGWAILAMILLAGLLVALVSAIRRFQANAYRREALRMLDGIGGRVRDPLTRMQALEELASLLKRTALAAWPRQDVAALSGNNWADFLREQGDDEAGHALERLVDDLEYHSLEVRAGLPDDVCDDLVKATRKWIEHHHVPA